MDNEITFVVVALLTGLAFIATCIGALVRTEWWRGKMDERITVELMPFGVASHDAKQGEPVAIELSQALNYALMPALPDPERPLTVSSRENIPYMLLARARQDRLRRAGIDV